MIMIMIRAVMVTAQINIRVDGGTMTVTTLTSTGNHLMYVIVYCLVR